MTEFPPGPPAGDLTVELDPDAVEAFHRDGFVRVDRITTDEEIQWLRGIFDSLFEERTGPWPGGYFDLSRPYNSDGEDRVPQVLHPESRVPALDQTLFRRNGRAIARQLLGCDDEAITVWGHMISKPAHHGAELPWHQDEAYWEPRFHYRALACWMPLDDATADNGCLHFLPGSHRGPVRPHRHLHDDPSIHGLETDVADAREAVAVDVPAGGATFHHCRTLHRSGPNRTDGVRRAYANEFQLEPEPAEDAEPRPWVAEGLERWRAAAAARAGVRRAGAPRPGG